MGGIFSSKPSKPKASPPPPPPPPPPPDRSQDDIQAAADIERKRRQRAGGRGSTIKTGGLGDVSEPSLAVSALLGR